MTFTDDSDYCKATTACGGIRDQVLAGEITPAEGALLIMCDGRSDFQQCKEQVLGGAGAGLEKLQVALTVIGFIPGLGEGADAANVLISLINGDVEDAIWSALAVISVVGIVAGAKRVQKLLDDIKVARQQNVTCPTRHSFDPDTPVLMADGTTKPIKDIEIGDYVLATDPETGRTEAKPVVALHRNLDHHLADIIIATSDGTTAVLHTTAEHRFWNITREDWTPAAAMNPGELLLTPTGAPARVIALSYFNRPAPMFNLTVRDIHTYYVALSGTAVLVHNAPRPSPYDLIDGPIPQRGQSALYMLFDEKTGEFLKWGVWTNNGKGRYTAESMLRSNERMVIVRNFDTKAEAHAAERFVTSRSPGPYNIRELEAGYGTGQSLEQTLNELRGGACW
jgi:hypothetical protein